MTGVMPHEQPIEDLTSFIDPDIESKLEVSFKFRGLVELLNQIPGEESVRKRLTTTFNYTEIDITTKNAKKGKLYGAKATIIGDIEKNILLQWSPFIVNPHILHGSKVQVETLASDKFKSMNDVIINTIKLIVSTATIAADIDIIPVFEIITETLIANKEAIQANLNLHTSVYAQYIDALSKARFTKNSLETFIGTLGEAINKDAEGENLFDYLDSHLETDEQKTVAKVYFALKK
jgi:hypothetical protein